MNKTYKIIKFRWNRWDLDEKKSNLFWINNRKWSAFLCFCIGRIQNRTFWTQWLRRIKRLGGECEIANGEGWLRMVNPSEGLRKLLRAKMREKRRFWYEQEDGSESDTAAAKMKWPELVMVVIRLLRRWNGHRWWCGYDGGPLDSGGRGRWWYSENGCERK
jgi:hypothetical protein